ncbi:MAG: hypothetical protein ACR2GG_11625 [Gemmatimonadaceae bacterium]
MNKVSVEIRSPRAQKIILSIFAVPCFCVAVLCWLSPFTTVFDGKSPPLLAALLTGVGYFVFGALLYWPVRQFVIRADEKSLFYHTGFKCKTVRWNEVAAFYNEDNQQPSGRFRVVFLDAQQEILLQIPAGKNDMRPQSTEQLSELRQFVDVQLNGKKVDAPFVSFEPEAIAERSIEVDWKSKTLRWKIARVVGLAAYAVFWCGVSLSLMLYTSLHYPGKPPAGIGSGLMLLALFSMFAGPLLPYIIWMKIKKRKIAREWKTRDKIES